MTWFSYIDHFVLLLTTTNTMMLNAVMKPQFKNRPANATACVAIISTDQASRKMLMTRITVNGAQLVRMSQPPLTLAMVTAALIKTENANVCRNI